MTSELALLDTAKSLRIANDAEYSHAVDLRQMIRDGLAQVKASQDPICDAAHKAQEKLARKGADLIVANDVTAPGAGFDVETNQVALVSASGVRELPLLPKREVAKAILDRVQELLIEERARVVEQR